MGLENKLQTFPFLNWTTFSVSHCSIHFVWNRLQNVCYLLGEFLQWLSLWKSQPTISPRNLSNTIETIIDNPYQMVNGFELGSWIMGGIGQLSRYVYPGHFISYALPLTFWIIFIGLGWSFTMSLEDICKHEILGGKWCTLLNFMCVFSLIWLFETLWIVTHQVHLSMGFPRQESWSGLSFSPPGDLPNPGIKSTSPGSLALQMDSLSAEPLGKPAKWKRWKTIL